MFTNADKVEIKKPDFTGSPVCTLQFGATIHELDAEIDARSQFGAVKSYPGTLGSKVCWRKKRPTQA